MPMRFNLTFHVVCNDGTKQSKNSFRSTMSICNHHMQRLDHVVDHSCVNATGDNVLTMQLSTEMASVFGKVIDWLHNGNILPLSLDYRVCLPLWSVSDHFGMETLQQHIVKFYSVMYPTSSLMLLRTIDYSRPEQTGNIPTIAQIVELNKDLDKYSFDKTALVAAFTTGAVYRLNTSSDIPDDMDVMFWLGMCKLSMDNDCFCHGMLSNITARLLLSHQDSVTNVDFRMITRTCWFDYFTLQAAVVFNNATNFCGVEELEDYADLKYRIAGSFAEGWFNDPDSFDNEVFEMLCHTESPEFMSRIMRVALNIHKYDAIMKEEMHRYQKEDAIETPK